MEKLAGALGFITDGETLVLYAVAALLSAVAMWLLWREKQVAMKAREDEVARLTAEAEQHEAATVKRGEGKGRGHNRKRPASAKEKQERHD